MAAQTHHTSRKIVLVGAGAVGSATAFALAQAGVAEELVLVDANANLARGQALDLAHGAPYYPSQKISSAAAPEAYEGASLVIISAGKAQAGPGQTRLDLLQVNAEIVTGIARQVQDVNPRAILLIASNPVDVLTHVVRERTGWPRNRIIGSGTVLDSARFRWLLGQCSHVSPANIHGYILGEHGDSEFAAWSLVNIGGIPFAEHCKTCGLCGDAEAKRAEILEEVRRSAYHIIGYKGSTNFGVAMAITQIARAILRNERRIMSVSANLEGEFGLSGVTLGVPCLLGAGGIEEILVPALQLEEQQAMETSAAVIREAIASLA